MGISGLTKVIKDNQKTPSTIQDVKLSKYSGGKLAIDVNIYLHGFAYNPSQKKPNSHLDGFFQMIHDLMKNKITPIMVLDGKPPKEKAETCKARSDYKQELETQILTLGGEIDMLLDRLEILSDLEENNLTAEQKQEKTTILKELGDKQTDIEKYQKRNIKVVSSMYGDIKQLFQLMGVPCIRATGEADALCVKLYKEGLVSGILSEDMDVLPFGGVIIRGIKDRRTVTVTEYNLPTILTDLCLTQAQLIDICILCGCDYSIKVKNIGPKTAYTLIKKYGTIEKILQNYIEPDISAKGVKSKYDKSNVEEFKKQYGPARQVLTNSADLENIQDIKDKLVLGKIDQDQLFIWLRDKCRYRDATLTKKFQELGIKLGVNAPSQPQNLNETNTKTKSKIVPKKIKKKEPSTQNIVQTKFSASNTTINPTAAVISNQIKKKPRIVKMTT